MSAALEVRVRARVIELFLGGDGGIPIEPETDLIASGICDSLGLVQLAADLEDEFQGLRIDDQDITHENMGSIRAIVALIEGLGARA